MEKTHNIEKENRMNWNSLNTGALILTLIGGLNWGLIGIADFNAVTFLLGRVPLLVTIVYGLVGVSALYLIFKEISCKTSFREDHRNESKF